MRLHLVSLFAISAATPALAQTVPTSEDDAIFVTATRSGGGDRVDTIGGSVTTIEPSALEERQIRIISDVLRDVPGIAVNRSGAVGGQTQVRLRGSESNHVLVLIDGIEVSDPFQGEFDFGTLVADEAARIEVLRGQQSALYGSDAIGGVVHYMTLSGREAPGIRIRAEGGGMDTVSAGVRVAGADGGFDYALGSSYYAIGGYPTARGGTRDIGAEALGASAKLGWQLSDALRLSAVGRYSRTNADTNDADSDPSSSGFGLIVDSPDVRYRNEAFYGLVRGELSLLDGRWTSALSAQIADTARRNFNAGGLAFGNDGQRAKGSFETALRFGEDRFAHRVTGAVDVERERFRNRTPSPFAFGGGRTTTNIGLVGEYGLVVDDALALGLAVRHDANTRFADTTTYRAQASYALRPGTRVRAAWGTGVKNPGFFELFGYSDGVYIGNPDLRPERSEGWEVGIEQSFAGKRATIGLTYFDSRLEDEVYTLYPPPTFVATSANRDTLSRQHGVELFVEARPVPQLRLDLAYTYLRSREDGVAEVRRPRHIGSFNLTGFTADTRGSATLTIRYNGRQDDFAYTDPSYVPVRTSLQAFVLVNLAARWRITDRLTAEARVENLLDERYEELFSFRGAGRAAYAGLRAAF